VELEAGFNGRQPGASEYQFVDQVEQFVATSLRSTAWRTRRTSPVSTGCFQPSTYDHRHSSAGIRMYCCAMYSANLRMCEAVK